MVTFGLKKGEKVPVVNGCRIATCQSAEMEKVGDKIKDLRGIFEEKSIVELPNISKATEIANKVEIHWNEAEFDGTIELSFLTFR